MEVKRAGLIPKPFDGASALVTVRYAVEGDHVSAHQYHLDRVLVFPQQLVYADFSPCFGIYTFDYDGCVEAAVAFA